MPVLEHDVKNNPSVLHPTILGREGLDAYHFLNMVTNHLLFLKESGSYTQPQMDQLHREMGLAMALRNGCQQHPASLTRKQQEDIQAEIFLVAVDRYYQTAGGKALVSATAQMFGLVSSEPATDNHEMLPDG